ncbi:MAG: PAS domain-containing protein, partial [Myxococcales bacterium]|nr:PAS domain-containing protein [Myxococcales bacterium]
MEWPARGGVVRLDDARARIERDGGALELALDGLELAYAPWEEDGAVIGSTVYLRAGDCVALRVRGLRAPSSRYGPPRTSDLELEMALDPCIDMLGALAAWRERRALRVGVGVDAQTRGDAREERRALAAERLRGAILERMAEGVNLVNPADGRILYTNRQFDEMFGYARGELFGQHVSILNAPTELTPVGRSAAIIKAVRRGNRWRGEVLNQRKDGAVFWSFAVVSEIEDAEHGRVWITLQMDITAQKQAE